MEIRYSLLPVYFCFSAVDDVTVRPSWSVSILKKERKEKKHNTYHLFQQDTHFHTYKYTLITSLTNELLTLSHFHCMYNPLIHLSTRTHTQAPFSCRFKEPS